MACSILLIGRAHFCDRKRIVSDRRLLIEGPDLQLVLTSGIRHFEHSLGPVRTIRAVHHRPPLARGGEQLNRHVHPLLLHHDVDVLPRLHFDLVPMPFSALQLPGDGLARLETSLVLHPDLLLGSHGFPLLRWPPRPVRSAAEPQPGEAEAAGETQNGPAQVPYGWHAVAPSLAEGYMPKTDPSLSHRERVL